MKFLRLRIANYRSIIASEVKFGSTGITLVLGPNEVGKTSLGEAIGLLFEYLDSSKHRDIEAIRPVHRDEGPEIELQAESGPYAFTYFKRFHKKPETKLTITRPNPENHTGREAHERAEAILRETLDIDLWKALTIQQGAAIHQPILTKQTSLSTALDKAAGGRPADPREEGLFEKVGEEHALYFTENGVERKELKEARKLQENTHTEVAEIEQQIRDLEQDIERAAVLQRELGQLKRREDELMAEVAAQTSSLEEIGTLENVLTAARLKLESEQKSEQAVRRDKETRQGFIDAVAKATKAHGDLEESTSMSLPASNQAEGDFKKSQAALNEADKKRKEADTLAALRRADFDYYNNKLHLDQLRERKERIDQARKNAAQAEEVLARNKVSSQTLQAIREAEKDLLTAKAKLETGAPHVLLHGLAECHVMIDGVDTTLDKGDDRSLSVADSLRLTLPRKLDIEITAGSSSEKLQKKVDDTQLALEDACKDAGVADPDEARRAFEERNEASRNVKSKEQVEKDNLRDLTYEQLERKLLGLQQSVPDYLAKRVRKPTICPDLASAKKERANAEAEQQKANGNLETARDALDAARDVRDGLSAKHQEARVQLDLLAKDIKRASENLDRARQSVPDDVLETTLTSAIRAVASEEGVVRTAEASLKATNPERVRALAETAKGSLQTTQNRRNAAQTELTEVQTRLKIRGEEGLHEKLHASQTNLERIETKNQSLFRCAASAKFLFEAMREERDKARRAYVGPLKEKIENLGRLVFDDSFQVEISEDLQIASRTVNGITVPFESLSGGTREQLSLIFRLACSIIVAKDGGTPLILDDALGYTDPDRLRLMGAVLAKAAKDCQIAIFTCVPDRYENVGEATIVPLR
ncbi:MAG: AAA family ATPase [Candidatus Eisenbacteria bacterium]|nr:AAA family ATPase [Candidatus Eisenbacteria bacterium]